jgi:hypothetical protein
MCHDIYQPKWEIFGKKKIFTFHANGAMGKESERAGSEIPGAGAAE